MNSLSPQVFAQLTTVNMEHWFAVGQPSIDSRTIKRGDIYALQGLGLTDTILLMLPLNVVPAQLWFTMSEQRNSQQARDSVSR